MSGKPLHDCVETFIYEFLNHLELLHFTQLLLTAQMIIQLNDYRG